MTTARAVTTITGKQRIAGCDFEDQHLQRDIYERGITVDKMMVTQGPVPLGDLISDARYSRLARFIFEQRPRLLNKQCFYGVNGCVRAIDFLFTDRKGLLREHKHCDA